MSGLQPEGHTILFQKNQKAMESGAATKEVIRPIEQLGLALREFDEQSDSRYHHPHPRAGELQYNAAILMQNREFALAQNIWRALLQEDSIFVPAIRGMANCFAALKDLPSAARMRRILVNLDDRAGHLIELADVLYLLCEDHEALKYYLMALRNAPGDDPQLFEVFKNIGNIFVRSHDFESAEDNYNKAYTLNPQSDALLVNYGTLEIQKGDLEKAAARFREAVQIAPNNDRGWVGLAIVHRQFGDLDLSWANLETALDLNPSNESALQLGLSWVSKDHKWSTMIRTLKRYLRLNGSDVQMSLALAQLFYLAGRFDDARLEIERALNLDPAVHRAHELLELVRTEVAKHQAGQR